MSRGLWFVAGAGAGIYVMVRGRRAAEALTVDGISDRLNGAAVGLRMFRDEVAQGKADKESELRERFAVPALGSGTAATTTRPELPAGPDTEGTT
ncbi:DUF6167 family protein [Nocardioides sp. SYSU D00038]|uniref:DUF6167 family protein n=1 Tax=Nocardioides sp. SYSU D00038 TaxID=2812554 RepID=UPI0019677810|nr:DUF6167 family protein [Nocardioides sp. SYSU D00038]